MLTYCYGKFRQVNMSLIIVGSSHVCRMEEGIANGQIYSGGKLEDFPAVTWLGKSGLRVGELVDRSTGFASVVYAQVAREMPDVVCLMLGGNDIDNMGRQDVGDVYENFKKVVTWIRAVGPAVLIVPLWHRQYPRTTKCSFRMRYPGSCRYAEHYEQLNFKLYELGVPGQVRVSPFIRVTNSDLRDCVHLVPSANKKVVHSIRRGFRLLMLGQ